jgi:hypothetical protein
MLRAYVLQYDKNWDKCLPLAEFSYNNSYQTSLKMARSKHYTVADVELL